MPAASGEVPGGREAGGGPILAAVLALGTLLGAATGAGAAFLLTARYGLDWYHHPARPTVGAGALLQAAPLVGAAAAVAALLAAGLVLRRWDAGAAVPSGWGPLRVRDARARNVHLLRWSLGTGLAAAAAAGIVLHLLAGASGMDASSAGVVLPALGGVLGAGAAGLAAASAGTNLQRGHLRGPGEGPGLVARASLLSSEHAVAVVVVILLVTVALGAGLPKIHTEVDVADVLPRGNPHTRSAHNLTDHFKSTYTQEMELQFEINPEQCREDGRENIPQRPPENTHCGNITDEVYIRAMEEFFEFAQSYSYEKETGALWWKGTRTVESPIVYEIGLPSFTKLFNWTLAGGQEEPSAPPGAYSLPSPDDRARSNFIRESGWELLRDTMTPTMDPSLEQAVVLYMVRADEDMTSQGIGEFMIETRDAYLEWAPEHADYQVFTGDNPPLHTVDLPVANAHASHLAQEDFATLLPLIALFLVVALFAAFRDVRSVLVAGTTLAVGVTWTYGLMGHVGIAMNTLNLTVVPLIMGSGIDYAIHMINEFLEHKAEGLDDPDAFERAGERAGIAMLIATVITVVGLVVMMASPSLLLAQLGFLSAVAIVSLYVLTIAFIPAVLTLVGNTERMGAGFRPSRLVPALGRFVHRHRALVAVVLVAAALASVWNLQHLAIEPFGEPALNWPEDDWLRREHEEGLRGFYDVGPDGDIFKTNAVVIEGDVTDPPTHTYIDGLSASLREESNRTDSFEMHTSRDLPFVIRSWLKVCCGPQSPVLGSISEGLEQEGFQEESQYPGTRAEIQSTLDDMFRSPYATFGSLFVDHPRNNITIITLSVKTGSFDHASSAWDGVTSAVDRVEADEPRDVRVSFVGNTPTNYLFVTEELPWLNYMSLAALAAAVLLVLAFTRDLRMALVVGLVVGFTSLAVLAVLPLVGIGLAITLMLPLVFVFNIGSDYAVHLLWNIEQVGDVERVYATVGKAVLFSAVTDVGAFLLFTPIPGTPLNGIRDLMVRQAMIATVVAITLIFLVTIGVVSLFYDVEAMEADAEAPHADAAGLPD